jgi:gluconate kinase
MLFIFFGTSCSGKSTAAEGLRKLTCAEIVNGKDYLRMAKNENEALRLFTLKLEEIASIKEVSSKSVIYIANEKDIYLKLMKIEGAFRVKFIADLDTLKLRFSKRLGGNMPKPVEMMIEKQMKSWEDVKGDMIINTSIEASSEEIGKRILEYCKEEGQGY